MHQIEFIFMLTHHDVTIPNALQILDEIKDAGVRCVGCKDIGLSFDQCKELFHMLKKREIESFLEVVTYKDEEHFRAVDLALKIGADNLIGGMPTVHREDDGLSETEAFTITFLSLHCNDNGTPVYFGWGR